MRSSDSSRRLALSGRLRVEDLTPPDPRRQERNLAFFRAVHEEDMEAIRRLVAEPSDEPPDPRMPWGSDFVLDGARTRLFLGFGWDA
jgi:hypothetical protein